MANAYEEMHQRERAGGNSSPAQQRDKLISWMTALSWFTGRMSSKMLQNMHKSGWEHLPVDYLRWRLYEEYKELLNALDPPHDPEEVINECADIANFAMMLADVIRAQTKESHDLRS